MGFTALVASDIFGEKINLEISFNGRPVMAELKDVVERCYNGEVHDRVTRMTQPPVGALPAYQVKRFQLFDEVTQKWVGLTTAGQLTDYCQLYAFQPPHPYHKEVRAPIPAPVRPKNFGLAQLSSPRPRSPARSAQLEAVAAAVPLDAASHEEKNAAVFEDLDANNDRVIDADEWAKAFSLLRFSVFNGTSVTDMFVRADANGDQRITYAEWQRFTELYPALLDSLYQRFQAYWEGMRHEQQMQDERERLEELKANLQRLEHANRERAADVAASEAQLAAAEGKVRERADRLRAAEDALRDAGKAAERAQRQVCNEDAELQIQREKERLKARVCDDVAAELTTAAHRHASAKGAACDGESRHRQLEMQLADTRSLAAREEARLQSARQDLSTAQGASQEAGELRRQAVAEVGAEGEELVRVEGQASEREMAERAAQQELAELQGVSTRCCITRDAEEKLLATQRSNEQDRNRERIAAERATEELTARLAALEKDNAALKADMAAAVAKETPLIENEMALRTERDQLEQKESLLRQDHRSFYTTTSPHRSMSRPASTRRELSQH